VDYAVEKQFKIASAMFYTLSLCAVGPLKNNNKKFRIFYDFSLKSHHSARELNDDGGDVNL